MGVGTYLSASRHMQNEEKDREKASTKKIVFSIKNMTVPQSSIERACTTGKAGG